MEGINEEIRKAGKEECDVLKGSVRESSFY